jgi:hypothetical protein
MSAGRKILRSARASEQTRRDTATALVRLFESPASRIGSSIRTAATTISK